MEGPPTPPPHKNLGPSTDIVGAVCITIEGLMVLANILPVLVVTVHKRDRITTDIIILALSITDVLSVLVPAPLGLPAYFQQRWYGGKVTCQLYQLTSIWFQLASMCLVTFMCLDRWYILRRVLNHRPTNNNINKTRAIIAGIYTFTLCIAALPIIGLAPKAISNTGLSCRSWVILTSVNIKEHIFYIVFLILGYSNLIIAISINTHVIYTLISLKKEYGRNSADRRLNSNFTNANVDQRTIIEMSTMSAVVTLIFYLAWLPVLVLISFVKAGSNVGGIAVLYALLSTTLTGLLNPVLYAAFTKSYKQGYISLLRSGVRRLCCCLLSPSRLRFNGTKDGMQWQMVNTVSNTSSFLGLLTREQEDIKRGSDVTFHRQEQNVTDPDEERSHVNDKTLSQSMFEGYNAQTCGLNAVTNKNVTFSDIKVLDKNGDVLDSGIFEMTYFDETLENDYEYDDDINIHSREFYGSKLSLLSTEDEEDDDTEIT